MKLKSGQTHDRGSIDPHRDLGERLLGARGTEELRLGARTLRVAVELHYLDAPVDELWRRLEIRNQEGKPGTAPIKRKDLERWSQQFEAPDAAELALFDEA